MRIVIPNQPAGTNLIIKARSKTGSSFSDWSRNFAVTTSGDTIAPKTPTNPVGSMAGTSFILKWDAVTQSSDGTPASDLAKYEVKVSSSGSINTVNFTTSDTKFEFPYAQNLAVFGSAQANVQMQVRAIDSAGNASAYTAVVSQTNPKPAAPTNLVGNVGVDSLDFSWTGVSDSDLWQYRLYTGTSSSSQPTLIWTGLASRVTIQSTDYTTARYYKVVAADVFGTESNDSNIVGPIKPNSTTGVDSNPPGVPANLTTTLANSADESNATATVSWDAVTDSDLDSYVLGYRQKASPVNDWQYVTVDKTNTTTKIQGLLPYTDYDFRVRAKDFSANYSNWSTIYTATSQANVAPSTPAAPTCVSSTMRIQVTIPGTKAAGGVMEGDVVHYEVYASTTTGFTPAAANQLGRMLVGPAMVDTFQIPASGGTANQTWYVKIIAVDRGGLKSAASDQATAAPGLIDSTNIVDLAVTNAKINDLAANKITAGTGFVNDLTVKSKFTLGDSTTLGIIESYGYSAGTTGFHFDKNLLEINQGVIRAPALQIQSGASNLERPEYSAFEFTSTFYTGRFGLSNGTASIQTAGGVQGNQFLRLSTTTAAVSSFVIGDSTTDYHISVEPGKTYIISAWMKASTATAVSAALRFKYSDGTFSPAPTFSTLPASGPFVRYSWAYTVPAGITNAVVKVDNNTATAGVGIDIDGLMVEQQVGGLTTPSTYAMPGMTSVDGGILRTGEIRSTSNVTVNGVSQPSWSINMAGGAQFGDAAIRGKLIVGPTTQTEYATNGNMEGTSLTAFTLYANSYMSTTSMVRTTTAGEVITGTGSLKFTGTDTTSSNSSMGFEVALGTGIPDANAINFSFQLRYLSTVTTNQQCYAMVQLLDSGGVVIKQKPVFYSDNTNFIVQGGTKTSTQSITVPSGYNAKKIRVVAMPSLAGTHRFIFDNISITASADLGASSISSGNYIQNGTGWRLNSSGIGEFNDITVRGVIGTAPAGQRIVMGDNFSPGYMGFYSGNAYEWQNGFISVADDASLTIWGGLIGDTIPSTPTGTGAGGAGGMGSTYSMGYMTIGKVDGTPSMYGFNFGYMKTFLVSADYGMQIRSGSGSFYISDTTLANQGVSPGTLLQGSDNGPLLIAQDSKTLTIKSTDKYATGAVNSITLSPSGIATSGPVNITSPTWNNVSLISTAAIPNDNGSATGGINWRYTHDGQVVVRLGFQPASGTSIPAGRTQISVVGSLPSVAYGKNLYFSAGVSMSTYKTFGIMVSGNGGLYVIFDTAQAATSNFFAQFTYSAT